MTTLEVGLKTNDETLNALTNSIIRILECNADQETLRHALDTFRSAAGVQSVTLSHCHLIGDRHVYIDDSNNVTEEQN